MRERRAALYTRLAEIMWSRLSPEDKEEMMDIIEEDIAELARRDRFIVRPKLALVEEAS